MWSVSRFRRFAAALVLAAALVGIALWADPPRLPGSRPEILRPEPAMPTTLPRAAAYRDLVGRYRGPEVDSVGNSAPTVDLSYRPAKYGYLFAALWVTGIRADGWPDAEAQTIIGPYQGAKCSDDCLEVELGVDSPAGLLRIPVATGHILDPESVRLDGRRLPVFAVASGQPALRLDAARIGRLRYRSGQGGSGDGSAEGVWPALPPDVFEFARQLEGLAISARAFEAAEFVRQHVSYDASRETAARYAGASEQSIGFFERVMDIGAGDCDVQNSLLVAILEASGTRSRLAVGWVGAGGRARKGLHAWAEYQDSFGRWRAVDASSARNGERTAGATTIPVASGSDLPRVRIPPAALTVSVTAVLLLLASLFAIARTRWKRSFRGGDADDVVDLLRGAAIKPAPYEGVHALFSRRLLKEVSGRATSLARASEMARKGRLACGSGRTELTRLAVQGGGDVLDLDQPESRAVAEVLGAVNLDRWQELLERVEGDELTTHVENRLAAVGESCRILVADNPGFENTILDGTAIGLATFWVVLDRGGRLWQVIHGWAGRRPARAALLLADEIIKRRGIPPAARHRCLSKLALEAILEAGGDRHG
jgi:transglutaminase-like putative cysteine protease